MRGSAVLMVLGIILMAVSFNVFPTIISGADAILGAANSSDYTGLASVVGIGPTLIFIGLLFGGMSAFGLGMKGLYGEYKKGK